MNPVHGNRRNLPRRQQGAIRKTVQKPSAFQFAFQKIKTLRSPFRSDRMPDSPVPIPLPDIKLIRHCGKHKKHKKNDPHRLLRLNNLQNCTVFPGKINPGKRENALFFVRSARISKQRSNNSAS